MQVVRSSACLSLAASLCVDTRQVLTPFGEQLGDTSYIGVRLGVGLATGLDW